MNREDAYNRIDAIIAKHEIDDEYVTITSALDYDALRFARKLLEQEPKTGHWIKDDITERSKSAYKHKCDRCGTYHRAMYDYCPSCGAKMVEPQEREG